MENIIDALEKVDLAYHLPPTMVISQATNIIMNNVDHNADLEKSTADFNFN